MGELTKGAFNEFSVMSAACEPSVLVPFGCEQVALIGDTQLSTTVLSKEAQTEGLGLSLCEQMATTNVLEPTPLPCAAANGQLDRRFWP